LRDQFNPPNEWAGKESAPGNGRLQPAHWPIPERTTLTRDFALSLLSSDQDAMYEIEEALKRIEKNTYGVCELTGKPIPKTRLEAITRGRDSPFRPRPNWNARALCANAGSARGESVDAVGVTNRGRRRARGKNERKRTIMAREIITIECTESAKRREIPFALHTTPQKA